MSRASAVRGSRLAGWHVRAILVALLVALLTPALATAQTATPEEAPPALEDLGVLLGEPAAEPAPPAAESPAPAEEPEPPATEPPPAPEPAAEDPSSPAPPPTAEEPLPIELPGLSPPPAPPPEATPTPSGAVTPALPGAPDAPRARPDVVLAPPVLVDASGAPPKALSPMATVKDLGRPAPPPTMGVASLGDPTAPPALPETHAGLTPLDGERMAPPKRPEFSTALLEPSRPRAAPTRRVAVGGPSGPEAASPDDNPFATWDAVGGPVPGSSLLAVLASYVIPGGGSLPTTTLLLFVQLAVILAACFAPRLGRGELALAFARLGPRSGYRTVLARPG